MLSESWQLAASYDFNQTRYEISDVPHLPLQSQLPKHLAKVWTTYRVPYWQKRVTVGAGVQSQSSTYEAGTIPTSFDPTTGEGNPPFVPFNFTQSGWTILNLFSAVRISDQFTVSVNLNNVTNKVYYKTVSTPEFGNWYGDPFNFMITLRYAR